jgi:hypothetical protein
METLNTLVTTPLGIFFLVFMILANAISAISIKNLLGIERKWIKILIMIPPIAGLVSLGVVFIGGLLILKENLFDYFKS